jgi:hypothetical protein
MERTVGLFFSILSILGVEGFLVHFFALLGIRSEIESLSRHVF